MGDYHANFGVVTKKDGVTKPAPEIVKVLGLGSPAQ